jgi:hypothetical protein
MWIFHDAKSAFASALPRCSLPLLHAHFIRVCPQQCAVVDELLHNLAQKGSVNVLEHLLQEALLTSDRLIIAINNGEIEGDQIVSVEWLQSHGLLINDIRQRLVPCHKKLIAYFREIDRAAVAAEPAVAAANTV